MGLHREPDQGTRQPSELYRHATLMPVSSQLYHLSGSQATSQQEEVPFSQKTSFL